MKFDFETNRVVDDVADVPERYRPLYTEATEGDDAGKHVLIESVRPLIEAYSGTSKALEKARSDKSSASDESAKRRLALKAFDEMAEELGIEAGDDGLAITLRSHITELMQKAKNGEEVRIDLNKIKIDFDKKQQAAVAVKDGEIEKLRADLFDTKVSDVASRAITRAKGSPDLLLPLVERRCKVIEEDGRYVVRVVDTQGDIRGDGKGGWLTVEGLIDEMKSQEMYARAFDSETPGGGGSSPGSGNRQSMQGRRSSELSSVGKIAQGLKKGQARGT